MPDIKKSCRLTGKDFSVTVWEQDFADRMGFGLPTTSPKASLQNRLAFRNERKIYKNKCAKSGRPIISVYSDDKPFKVYAQDIWWGDNWDPRDYGRDFDFNRPFFEQFKDLTDEVPRLSLINMKGENSEYCNLTTSNKNCYLVFGGDFNEDCSYSLFCMHSRDCSDTYLIDSCELCYDIMDSKNCYNCKYCQDCTNCKDSAFLYECRGCSNCFGCIGLANKQYYILNKSYTPEEYEEKIKEFRLDSFESVSRMKKTFRDFKFQFPHRFAHLINCENCTGDNIINAKNCIDCFDTFGPVEDLYHMYLTGWDLKDSARCDHTGHKSELCYESFACVGGRNYAFSISAWDSSDIYYSQMVVNNCEYLFGCTQMKKAKYCILNKQYSEEEYFRLRAKVIEHMKKTGEWGEFFPMEHSPFCYNETVAQDLFPLNKEEVVKHGLQWLDEEVRDIDSGDTLPDSIHDATEDVLSENYVCKKTGRPYKINEKELKLYKKIGVPLPRLAPDTRNDVRLAMRKPRDSWNRNCEKCGTSLIASYPPNSLEKIYCEKCFLETIE